MSGKKQTELTDTGKELEELRQQILKLRTEVHAMKNKTAEAEETLQNLNKLLERIEARKQAKSGQR